MGEWREGVRLIRGDCLDVMRGMDARSVDAVITDLPYGTTQCAWDEVIPLQSMWKQVKRVMKSSGAFITTANNPFASILIASNLDWFKYDMVWRKDKATGHLNANVQPMREHELILVFGPNAINYNPQLSRKPKHKIRPPSFRGETDSYGDYIGDATRTVPYDMSYPRSVLDFNTTNHGERGLHPTQKPESLYKYLVLTYTNAGDTVLDLAMGSGTTGAACVKTGRRFVGIEKVPEYYAIAKKRIAEAQLQPRLFDVDSAPKVEQIKMFGG